MSNTDISFLKTSDEFLKTAPLKPKTFNDKTRSVKVIAKSEEPVFHMDPEFRKPVYIITLVNGAVLPDNGQVPLLDSHNRFTVSSILGSVRNFRVIDGNLECEVFFSGTKSGLEAAQKVKEGHITDFSIGCRYIESYWIKKGKTKNIDGRTFKGPVRVVRKWSLYELSIVAVGADKNAKARSENENTAESEIEVKEKTSGSFEDNEEDQSEVNQEIDIIDKIFYAFILFMILFLLRGLLV